MRAPRVPSRLLPALFVPLVWVSCLQSPSPPNTREAGPVVKDEWHRVLISAQPAGHVRTTVRARPGGGFSVTVAQKLVVKRGEVVVPTESSSTLEEDAQGRLVGFSLRQALSRDVLEVRGRLEDDTLVVTEQVAGQDTRHSTIPAELAAIGAHTFDRFLREKLNRVGDTFAARSFVPELRKYGLQSATYLGEFETPLGDGRPLLKKISITTDLLPNLVTTQWLDAQGDLQKSSISALGHEIETYRSSAAEILKDSLTSPPEIFFSTSVAIQGKVQPQAKAITYRIKSKAGELTFDARRKLFPAAGMEESRPGTSTERWVRVQRVKPSLPGSPGKESEATLAEYLRPNSFVQSDDASIIAAARKVADSEPDPWQKAIRLERWVSEAIVKKDMNTAFASAREVMSQREGDCTEHAVLLAAMLRAVKLPSRVVAGLVEYQDVFVGHMWTEVHINGWIPLDATRAQGSVGPDHVGLSVSSLDAASIVELFLDIVPIIGSVSIEVVEIEN